MRTLTMRFASFLGCLLLPLFVPQLQAQTLTRTFISGLGSDSNPCSRAQPCMTLSGALANTSSGGEIDVLDATELLTAGTNPLTITKSVSIIGAGARGGVTGELIISPPAGGQVLLKGLDINANNQVGVSVTTSVGITLIVEDCTIINGITGINFNPGLSTATSYLVVRNSTIDNNKASPSGNVGGVVIQPGSTGPSIAVLEGVHVNGNYVGVWAFDYANVTIRNSVMSQSTFAGVKSQSNLGATVTVLIEHSQSSHNGSNGVVAVGTGAVARISDVTITDNVNGLVTGSGGSIISFGNNSLDGNGTNGAPTSTITLK